jgi:nitrate/nitrite transport system ATP-binding protein
VAERVQDRALFRSAATALGLPAAERPPSAVAAAFESDRLDPLDPLSYLERLPIKGQVTVAPAPLPPPPARSADAPVPAPAGR